MKFIIMENHSKDKWAKCVMYLAAIYNLTWGGIISLWPQMMLFGNESSFYLLMLIRCIGMLVGTYGIAYYFAATNPARYWPLILVGFIGKVLGPVGAVYYIWQGQLTPHFLWVNVGNDLIWLVPFGWVLWRVLKNSGTKNAGRVTKSLYQQFLANKFEAMAPNLQSFHSAKSAIKAKGRLKVVHGTHPFCRLIAKLANLPAQTPNGEAELIVEPNANCEIWSRRIDNKKVISKQWLRGGFLVERFKVLHIYLTANVSEGRLIIQDAFVALLGLPLPKFFTPKVLATGTDTANGVNVEVDISFHPFGRIINYKGVVAIEELV